MFRRLPVWAAWLLAFIALVGAITFMAYEEHNAAVEYKRQCQAKGTSIATATSKQNVPSQEECKDPKNYMPWWYILIAWPDGITVWAIIATGFVIGWQSYETQAAAEAALLNVRALIHSQRPWLVVQIQAQAAGTAAKTQFQFQIYNYGNSPAYVTSCSKLTVSWLENPNLGLPPKPTYEGREWDTRLLLPKDSIPIETIDPWADEVMQGIPRPPKMQLVVYGVIDYTDGATDDIHRTAFCYRRKRDKLSDMGGHLVLCGPSEYNRHT